MNIVALKSDQINHQADPPNTNPVIEGCQLGRSLGDCPLRRSGCGSLYQGLLYVMPPWPVRVFVREFLPHDAEAQAWLSRLDDALGGRR